jgi:hypothetical protein
LPVETLPQSIVEVKTIVLKPRLDQSDILAIGDKVKPQLFSKFGFKPKPEVIKLLAFEQYFEPYFVIGGKYVLDYCRKHVIEAEVDKKTTRLYVAGQEFNSKESDSKTRRRVVELTGEEHVHHEKQGYYILDRMTREIPPESLPLSPFVVLEKSSELNYLFKRMHISDEIQIEFLKTKIAQRPADVAEIMKEIFDITDRTITYYPMYLLTFEETRKRKEATVSIDGITGQALLNGIRHLEGAILSSRESHQFQTVERIVYEEVQTDQPIGLIPSKVTSTSKDEAEVSPKEDRIIEPQLSQPVVCGEAHNDPVLVAVPSAASDGSGVSQVIESDAARTVICEKVLSEPVQDVVPSPEKGKVSEKEDSKIESKRAEPLSSEKLSSETGFGAGIPIKKNSTENPLKDDQTIVSIQPEGAPAREEEQIDTLYIFPPAAKSNTSNVPEEETLPLKQSDEDETITLGFPARILGEVIEMDDNMATIEGDVEIPSGTNINKNLLVKGSLKIGDNCRGHGKLEAFKDITIGADTIIDGNLISGANIFVGSRSLINGLVEALGEFAIEEDAMVGTTSR